MAMVTGAGRSTQLPLRGQHKTCVVTAGQGGRIALRRWHTSTDQDSLNANLFRIIIEIRLG